MSPRRLAWFHCPSGIAGDMALGSLIDAGASVEQVASALEGLGVPGLRLRAEKVQRSGIAATRAVVEVEEDGVHRGLGEIERIITGAPLPERVTARSIAVFQRLAEVEAVIHSCAIDQVQFHEVGGHDAIADIVGTAVALELLDVDEVRSGPVALGQGMIRSAHGMLPNPAPAVLALLENAPVYGREIALELTTPTGAAILAAIGSAFSPMPAMRLLATGYGAGSRDLEAMANVTQVVLGELGADAPSPLGEHRELVVLEANLDDVSGEQLADALDALLAHGALDAWITPIVMKKGRPAHQLSALVSPERLEEVRSVLLRESGSHGARSHPVDRFALHRREIVVHLDGHALRVKVTAERSKVEHDDALVAARALGITVAEAISRAEQAARDLLGEPERGAAQL